MKEKYYPSDSIEDIQIQHRNGEVKIRPLGVKDMKVHTVEQLEQLESKAVWTISELRKIEGW